MIFRLPEWNSRLACSEIKNNFTNNSWAKSGKYRIVDVYITGKMVDTVDLNKVTEYVESVNKDDNAKNNFRIKINNSGYEKKN